MPAVIEFRSGNYFQNLTADHGGPLDTARVFDDKRYRGRAAVTSRGASQPHRLHALERRRVVVAEHAERARQLPVLQRRDRLVDRPAPLLVAIELSVPESVALTVDGTTWIVDVGCDRDDWSLPEVDADAARLLWAIDEAIEAWHADNEPECRRIERVWAGAVSW